MGDMDFEKIPLSLHPKFYTPFYVLCLRVNTMLRVRISKT
jgi:hypothetical protein